MRGVFVCVALAGCTSPPTGKLITSLYEVSDLHADGGMLTFETSTGHVVRMPATDPSQAVVLGDTGCAGLALDATSVYFFGPKHPDKTCDLLSVPLTGGAPVTLAANLGPGLLALGPTQVIVDDFAQLFSVPLTGGAPTPIGDPAPSDQAIDNVVVDGTTIYDTMHLRDERLDGTCEQRSLDGTLVATDTCPTNGRIAIHAGTFYLGQGCIQDQVCGSIYTFSLADHVQHLLAHSDAHDLWQPIVHGDHLYWGETNHTGNDTQIVRANLDGGAQTVIAETTETAYDFAVDDSELYLATDIALYRTPD